MTWRKKQIGAVLFALALVVSAAQAQQKDTPVSGPVQPYPPLSAEESSSKAPADADRTGEAKPKALSPDTRPLTGAEQFTLGSGGFHPLYLLPQVQIRQFADTNPGLNTGSTRIDSAAQLAGGIVLERLGASTTTTLTYAGGGTLYNTGSYLNQSFHQLSVAQQLKWRRWDLFLADQASYLPESSFGFGGFSSLSGIGSGGGSLGSGQGGLTGSSSNLLPIFTPNQTILTGFSRRITNAMVGQADYSLSPRTSITTVVSYGILHFLESGFVDNRQLIIHSGYNHALNRHDTVGINYGFTRFSFSTSDSKVENHFVHLAYGRRITGRLALQVSAGPRVRRFQNVAQNNGAQVSWSMGGALAYRRLRDGFSMSYHRGVTGGSGEFLGATNNTVQVNYHRLLSRLWSVDTSFGYGRNVGLRETNLRLNNFRFQTWHGMAGLRRPLGRQMHWGLDYRIHRQGSDNSVCIASSCGRVFLRHQITLTFDWQLRPIRVE